MTNVFDPLMTEIEVLGNGGAEKVPVTFAAVPPFVTVTVFAPLVIATLPAPGAAVNVPVALFACALVVRFNTFEFPELEMLSEVEDNGAVEKLPVSVAYLPWAVKATPLIVTVSVAVPCPVADTVPVRCAASAASPATFTG